MANVGSRQASWRILRKIYALRVEFEQAGSLGELHCLTTRREIRSTFRSFSFKVEFVGKEVGGYVRR